MDKVNSTSTNTLNKAPVNITDGLKIKDQGLRSKAGRSVEKITPLLRIRNGLRWLFHCLCPCLVKRDTRIVKTPSMTTIQEPLNNRLSSISCGDGKTKLDTQKVTTKENSFIMHEHIVSATGNEASNVEATKKKVEATQPTGTIAGKAEMVLINSNEYNSSFLGIAINYKLGDITDTDYAIKGCNIIFNPSNETLGTKYGGGAEGAIRDQLVKRNYFVKATREMITIKHKSYLKDNKIHVPPSFAGYIQAPLHLQQKGFCAIVHQVAPRFPKAGAVAEVVERSKAQNMLANLWKKGLEEAGKAVPKGQNIFIVTTALAAGSFGAYPEESIGALKQAIQQLSPELRERIKEIRIIDPAATGKAARGKSSGSAVKAAVTWIFPKS